MIFFFRKGRNNAYPIYVSIANSRSDEKVLVGMIPIDEKKTVPDNLNGYYNMLIYHRCIEILFADVKKNPGNLYFFLFLFLLLHTIFFFLLNLLTPSLEDFVIEIEGKKIATKIFISLLLADKKDIYLAARKKGSNYSKLKRACYTCEVPGELLDSFNEW